MNRRRLLPVLLQIVIAIQAGFVAAVLPAAPITPAAAAAQNCSITPGAGGGIVTSCPEADDYADLVDQLQIGFNAERGDDATQELTITSDPAGATVAINGLVVGTTPLDTDVPGGNYLVRLSKSGFEAYSTSVLVGDGPANVNVALNPVAIPTGSFEWLRAATLTGLVGANPNCDLEASYYVRDRDGADYVAFGCMQQVEYNVAAPAEAPSYITPQTRFRPTLRTSGVARSTDDGATWTLVDSWTDTFAVSAWTSPRFTDLTREKAADNTDPPDPHWMRAYYQSTTVEIHSIWGLIPKEDGGVSILLNKTTNHNPQATVAIYDNGGTTANPNKHMGSPNNVMRVFVGNTGMWQWLASSYAQGRFGVSAEDLGTYNSQITNVNTRVDSTGGESNITITGPATYLRPAYMGSHEDTDYFAGVGLGTDRNGYIFKSTDGGQTITLDRSYNLGETTSDFSRAEDLRIAPDGKLYIVDQSKGGVYALEESGARLLGRTPSALNFGVAGGNNGPFTSVDFDSAGNLHGAFRSSLTQFDNSQILVYYQFFPLQPGANDGVALFTEPGCALCDATQDWLDAAGVSYQLNPEDLPAEVEGTVAVEAASRGYPVVVRTGESPLVRGGADPATASRTLRVSYPMLVEQHQPRVSNRGNENGNSPSLTLHPQWLMSIVQNDQPHIILDRRDGVVDLANAGGEWTASPLMAVPPSITDLTNTTFSKRYPAIPGGGGGLNRLTQRDMRHNEIATVDEFRMLYNSSAYLVPNGFGATQTQREYTLWRTDGGQTEGAFRAVQEVSQLIPAAAFYVALGEHGTPGAVEGELAGYVTEEGIVADDGERFYRVVVDLRAQSETATNGNLNARGIGGQLHVDTQTEDGAPDARDISLILLVNNTRLRTFDPATRAASRDITVEAVHFTGPGEHWRITNNIGLPNEIPCGPDQALLLDPFSTSSFTAAAVSGFEIGSCLAAAEVTPTVIADCSTWDDVKLVLAGDTIASLAGSLPLLRSEDITNWELSYGSTEATIHRIVSFNKPADDTPAGSCPASAGEIANSTASVVSVSGPFIGEVNYQPNVTIVDQGTAAILTAPKAQPGSLAWEREWLEFESSILQGNLSLSIRDEAITTVLFLGRAGKRAGYQRALMATRALLHCNYEGVGVAAVRDLIARQQGVPGALRDPSVCLQGFVLNPQLHWPSYSPSWWSGGSYEADFVGSVISHSLTANPTLNYLTASSDGTVLDYGEFLRPLAQGLASHGNDVATDLELDHYARMATSASRELGGIDGRLLRAVLMSGQLERSAMRGLIECARTMTGDTPLATMIELTSQRAYQPGIPCVDSRVGAARDARFQMVGIALRGGTWGALHDASGRDLDMAFALLEELEDAYDAGAALESQYPPGTTAASWRADLPATDRLMIALRQMGVTQEARGRQITVAELPQLLRGVTECGVGFVKSFFPDGLLILGATGAAVLAGPFAAAVGGAIFLGFGLVVTGLGIYDLAQVWETLDLAAKTTGICGSAVGGLLTAAGFMPALRSVRALTPDNLRFAPPKMLSRDAMPATGRSAGLTLEEQGAAMTERGGTIEPPAPVPTAPLSAEVQTAINRLSAAEQPAATHTARKLNLDQLSQVEKDIALQLLGHRESIGTTRAQQRTLEMLSLMAQGLGDSPQFRAWETVGLAVLEELAAPLPKSVAAEPVPAKPAAAPAPAKPARVAGTDAEIVAAADNAGVPPDGVFATPVETVLARQPRLLEAVLGSERLLKLLQDPTVQRLFTFEEAHALYQRAHKARSAQAYSFFSELARPRFAASVRSAVAEAQRLIGATGVAIVGVESSLLPVGTNKVAVRLTVRLADNRTLDIAVTKGNITTTEANVYSTYGPKQITPNLLTPLLENVDGAQSLMITEFVPGLEVSPGIQGFLELYAATQDPGYAGAIGALDARIWLRTRDGSGRASYNTDLHLGNVNVFERNGVRSARAVDYDPQFTHALPEDGFWVTQLLRRHSSADEFSQAVQNFDGYLTQVVDQFAAEPGFGRQAGLDMLGRARNNLANQALVDQAGQVQGPGLADPAAVIQAINDFLATQ